MKKIVLLMMFAMLGCVKDGKDGINGINGVDGADATSKTYNGYITSDTQTVYIPGLAVITLPMVTVYVSGISGSEWMELSIYNAGTGGNIVASIFDGKVVIWYGYSNGFRKYYIVVVEYPAAQPSAKARFSYF